MPEGDTLFRTAAVLRRVLLGGVVTDASGRAGGAQLGRVIGRSVVSVAARGKHLLIGFSAAPTPGGDAGQGRGPAGALTLHTHLGMHGSWHRYGPDERWSRDPRSALAVVRTNDAVAVCFDAPTVELLETRTLPLHPTLRRLGPDMLAASPDFAGALGRLRDPARARVPIGNALLDQGALAGVGNVYRSEICFLERVDPFAVVGDHSAEALAAIVATAARLLDANRFDPRRTTVPDALGGPAGSSGPRLPGGRLWVYGRAGRPCRRCGTPIRSRTAGPLARRVYWCPGCQPGPAAGISRRESSRRASP